MFVFAPCCVETESGKGKIFKSGVGFIVARPSYHSELENYLANLAEICIRIVTKMINQLKGLSEATFGAIAWCWGYHVQ